MNPHLQQQIEELLAQDETVTLATCGQAGPQISHVPYATHQSHLYLFVPYSSDHLFNLETQPELVLLSPGWKLSGQGDTKQDTSLAAPYTWQAVITVHPRRLHILSEDGQSSIETIDFET
ncbi:MAG: pyridoxamine 5'-phosphate oxidase family protein [Anaerolineae bacterium]|nr:pyridoxamine 5'-phosphate oxidase family protein [Anaerolineae bacterium]